MSEETQGNALSGIRVVDLTHVIAGPFCTYQLAVLGAEVIKIEPPDRPDMTRPRGREHPEGEDGLGPFFCAQNGNKRAVSVDLKHPRGQEVLKALVRSADVFVENYRAGAMAKLGLDYESLQAIRPELIYCSMTGFGQQGPLAGRTAYDNVIQAYSGLMAATGHEASAPVKVGPPVLDYGTGIQAAYAIAAALFQRTRTGKGQHIDIAMLDSALMLMSANVAMYRQTGELIPVTGNDSAYNAGYCCYATADGQLMLGAFTGEQVRAMWEVLGDPGHGEELSRLTPPAMIDHLEQDRARIASLLLARSADEWETAFNAGKVPAARVRQLDETLADAHLAHRDVMQTVEQDGRDHELPVAAFRYADGGPTLDRAPPVFAEHTREVLTEVGYGPAELDELAAAGAIRL